jgi:hypothetical protein
MSRFKHPHLFPLIGVVLFLLNQPASATILPHTPNVSVHETHYGIELTGTTRQSVESIAVRIFSHTQKDFRFVVQCFFLKNGIAGSLPTVNDTVIFEVTRPHATYEVTAKPIKLSGGGKTSGATSSKTSTSKTINTSSDHPRAGFIVRILCDGIVLDIHSSGSHLYRLAKENPQLLDQAAGKKSARHLQVTDLLKK